MCCAAPHDSMNNIAFLGVNSFGFGKVTMARNDMAGTVPEPESVALINLLLARRIYDAMFMMIMHLLSVCRVAASAASILRHHDVMCFGADRCRTSARLVHGRLGFMSLEGTTL